MKNNKNKGGAPKKALDQKQSQDLRCRVTISQKEAAKKLAVESGYEHTSDFVRDCVFNSVKPKAIVTEPSRAFLHSSQSYFSNFNQFVHVLHKDKDTLLQVSVDVVIETSSKLLEQLKIVRREIEGNISNDTIIALVLNNLSKDEFVQLQKDFQIRHPQSQEANDDF
ncbi:hypothetical protein BCV09_18070 [Vibrio cyclitrophicus]|uniref:hypothetical protein n=1 Tax=Vibrio cyclitrophicus TaxID=47951 RepID=UPI000C8310AB|nr:hypothetical protein [Vibrio cyclitrophicus]PMF61373.1 hypothetical protein BCV09_16310 [Vibrio cyclitrophicus]